MMASFHAKIAWKMMRKRENKYYRSVPYLPDAEEKIPKKFKKKKKKKTIMALFPTKICWERQRKTENKNDHSVSFLPDS